MWAAKELQKTKVMPDGDLVGDQNFCQLVIIMFINFYNIIPLFKIRKVVKDVFLIFELGSAENEHLAKHTLLKVNCET